MEHLIYSRGLPNNIQAKDKVEKAQLKTNLWDRKKVRNKTKKNLLKNQTRIKVRVNLRK
jgi:hypothetical protein